MSLARFFIDRPIFAGVISVAIFLVGLIAMYQLPVSEYPEIVPPSVVIRAQFPGASPEVMAETVATPLEEQINGVENMLYMLSQAATDGTLTLTVTFKLGTDPDLATQLVQNRVNQALPRLPEVTRLLGIVTEKSSPDLTMVVHLLSPNGRYDMTYLRNYALLNIKDQLSKIPGIGSVQLFGGGDYAMRIWLNPQRVAERSMTAGEVIAAIRRQNVQVAHQGVHDRHYLLAAGVRMAEAEAVTQLVEENAPDIHDGQPGTRVLERAAIRVEGVNPIKEDIRLVHGRSRIPVIGHGDRVRPEGLAENVVGENH